MDRIFGIEFSDRTESELVSLLTSEVAPRGGGVRSLFTANLDHIVNLQKNAELRDAYRSAWAATIDGFPVFLYSRLRGSNIRSRVTGSDLTEHLLARLPAASSRCFLVTSTAQVAEKLATRLTARGFSPGSIAFDTPPFGFEEDGSYSSELARRVRAHGTTHLFLGVGSPKSEVWVHRYRRELGDCYALCVGAGLEFFVEEKRRAPRWMRRFGLEWFWRLAQEPRRLFRRYILNSWSFLGAVWRDLRITREVSRPAE